MDWVTLLVGIFGGGGITSVAIALINKHKTPTDVTATMTEVTDKLLHSISALSEKEVKSVENSYSIVIKNYETMLGNMQKDAERRDSELVKIITDNREHTNRIEKKLDEERENRKSLNAAINLAYDCEHLKGKSPDNCVVLQGRENGCDNCTEKKPTRKKKQ